MATKTSTAFRGLLWATVVLCGLGNFVAGYLVTKRFTGGSLACTRWAQCDVVNNSVYSQIHGVPVSVIGLAGYLLLLALAFALPRLVKIRLSHTAVQVRAEVPCSARPRRIARVTKPKFDFRCMDAGRV